MTEPVPAGSLPSGSLSAGPGDRPVRVLLADDEELIRYGVRLILRHADGIEVVGEAVNGEDAVRVAAETRPDVALVDIRMPVLDGLAAIEGLLALRPQPRVVMLTTFGDEENVTVALRAGAAGFLLKDEGPQELIRAVRAASAGDAVLSPGVTGTVIERMLDGDAGSPGAGRTPSPDPGTGGRLASLTGREREVLTLLGQGLANAAIGRQLGIGVGTVKSHVSAILEKTGTDSRLQAAVLAYRTGLVT
ncbi:MULTISPECIES: response regulator [Streptomyces]|uniref:DNA-binding response regulator n=1 Tax=Streptomyces tsukubensis (strain DSM 42081 / NBRC 108919 / NRRL 18488 / 9993) TaxID=1114943 RepID=I2N8C1_STRT9|nr:MULTISPECIES: response regulator transcription factor [Streptomyces]AZK97170.1 DNA-binding response regulator [Streptomyces tsukubensis]EIF93268.1 two component system response regulator [Streptomyces tsukubensis NRRL18488]MYS68187.1 response regulator [Streptomyces sp. SID5473]QKM66862.1 DNA-binding response regulator [Streptomyces tsukubensis NRRL18488]TAI44791.1 response regulator transcription factor [Streptomyces tsukubensis]